MTRKYVFTHLYDTEEEAQSGRTLLMSKFSSSIQEVKIVKMPYGFILQIDTKAIPEDLFEEVKAEIELQPGPEISRKPEKLGRPTRVEVTAEPAEKPLESKPGPKPAREPKKEKLKVKPAEEVPGPKLEPKTKRREMPTTVPAQVAKPRMPAWGKWLTVLAVIGIAGVMAIILPKIFISSQSSVPVMLMPENINTSGSPPSIYSKYLSTSAPTIDGVLTPSEWPEPAFDKTFTYSFQNEEKTGVMKGYFMNDNNSLYVATTITAEDFNPDIFEKEKALLALDIFFDENNDGILRKGEDNKKFWQFQYEDWHQEQEDRPYSTTWDEQQDGKGVCIYSDTTCIYIYECQIPLNSGDNEDLAVKPGDVMGIRLVLTEYIETEASKRWENIGFDSWPTGQGWIDGPYGQLVLVTSSTPSPTPSPTPTPTFWVPDNYTTIQAAVNAASPGDTIIVRDGTYNENVNVSKRLTIRSENGAANCVVSASKSHDHVFYVTADYVNISGFTVRDATGYYNNHKAGIYLNAVNHCNISSNTASNNYDYGIYLDSSSNNTLNDNTASSNSGDGIYLYSSSNNIITSNNASNNVDGIYLGDSSSNILIANNASNNYGYSIYLHDSDNNNLTGNNASGNGYAGIFMYNSSNNTINNNNASDNGFGSIRLWSSNNNTLTSNNASNNDYGIYLDDSSSNTLTSNNASNNDYGIYLNDSGNNLTGNTASSNNIYLNSFIGNIYNIYSSNSTNTWNSAKQITYTYKGTNYTNYLGNYWSDYAGSDPDGDGVGDSPYSISGDNPDHYPLMQPFENYRREPSPLPPAPTPTPSPTPTPTLWVPDNYTMIHAAVNAASPGDTIIVRDGTYNENVKVSKRLTIRSENGAANCIVSAAKSNDHVFYVTADYVNITGFTVQNATGDYACGIYLYHADHCAISDNNLMNNDFGIYLSSSSNNIVTSNTASNNNDYGIRLSSSSNNTINDNTAFDNGNYGIYLRSSNNSNLTSNDASNNGVDGIRLSSSSNNNLTDNTASNNNNYGISLCDSSNNTLSSNTASNNDDGIRLISSDKNTFTSNTAAGNGGSGIYLENSRKNTLTHNTASNNHVYDIYLDWTSSSNTIDGKTASND